MTLLNSLITLKNAQTAFLLETKIHYTLINLKLVQFLVQLQLIRGYKIMNKNTLILYLHYFENKPLIKHIRIFSKPSKKTLIHKNNVRKTHNTFYIINTQQGLVITNYERTLCGELIACIYV